MLLTGVQITYTCPECGASSTSQSSSLNEHIDELYDKYLKHCTFTCTICQVDKVISDVKCKIRSASSKRYKTEWYCGICGRTWDKHIYIPPSKFRQLDFADELRKGTNCTCKDSEVYMGAIELAELQGQLYG